MGRQTAPRDGTSRTRLAVLEHTHKIDRAPMEARLRQAIAEQQELDVFVHEHAEHTRDWEDLARRLTYQARKVRAAVDLLRDALKTSRFDDRARAHFAVRLHELRSELGQTIPIQAAAARYLASVAGGHYLRGPGHPKASIVNACLAELVVQLRTDKPALTGAVRHRYVASLAQFCGVLESNLKNPGEALRKRLRRPPQGSRRKPFEVVQQVLMALPDRHSEKPRSGREVAAEAFDVVHGRWPEERKLPNNKYWKSLESSINPDPKGRKSIHSKQSGRRGRNKKTAI